MSLALMDFPGPDWEQEPCMLHARCVSLGLMKNQIPDEGIKPLSSP